MCSPYVPTAEKYFCMNLDHKKNQNRLSKLIMMEKKIKNDQGAWV
jgi:hypothetical protein